MAAPIKDLPGVKAWLGTLTSGSTVPLSASMFDAPEVKTMFDLLPDEQPIPLTVAGADAAAAKLTGTAKIVGQPGATATFQFSEVKGKLLCELTAAMPESLAWTLIPDLHVGFGSLVGHLVPDPALGTVGLTFDAVATAGTTGEVNIPLTLAAPSFEGDWLVGAGETKIGSLTADALEALAGGLDPTAILPAELTRDLSKLELTGFQTAFNPAEGTCSVIRVGLAYLADWQFFDGRFTVQSVNFGFQVAKPFQEGQLIQAQLDAEMQIGGKDGPVFDVGGQFGDTDQAVFARLEPGKPLNVTDVLEFMHVPLPAGFPAINISTLSFVFYTAAKSFDFQLAITDPVPIIGSAKLDNFFFEIGATYDAAKGIEPSGNLHSQFSIGPSKLLFAGSYAPEGVVLSGEVDDVDIGHIVDKLAADFHIPKSSVPGPIQQLKLKTAKVSVDTTTKKFEFTCEGVTEFSGVTVDFTPTIALTYGDKFTAVFGGTLVLKTKAGKTYKFTVTYNGGADDQSITAEYKGEPVGLEDLADALKLDLPAHIPSDLDLALDAVGLLYDFGTGTLVVGADSKNYGKATLASMKLPVKPPPPQEREFFFVLDTGKSFSLSNLPLVGHELAQIEEVSIGQLKVVIGSAVAGKEVASAVNKEIAKLKSATYPPLPDAGVTSNFQMSAEMMLGSHKLPLNVAFGGAKPKGELTEAGASGLGAAADGGATWLTVQKSFGPVTISRVGVLYQPDTQTLWFELDASLAFGPLEIDLIGLGIGSPIKSFHPQFNLQGLGVAYSQPPLVIEGGLASLAPPGSKYIEFEGGLVVGTGQFTLGAFGYYGDKEGFPSMFVFGDIAYPFGGPPEFFVTGAALGFGYNSELRTPTIEEVSKFPFVEVLPSAIPSAPSVLPDKTPLGVLTTILQTEPPWVKSKAGSLWVAAGITFTTYEILNSQALLTVEVGRDELVIALIGTAAARFPQAVVPGPAYANVELDILIRLAPFEGVFSMQAQLASSSFLLHPSCVLTGGFAFFVWYGSSPYAGDFVLTLGGYNPAYTPPAHYPAVPPVGFHWSVDDAISVSGAAYMALTPAALMAGARLDATFQAGNLKAWFDAHADLMIRWKPFWIEAEIGISIGASYKVDLLLTSFTVTVELGCSLELWGPETGGTVEVDWYVISFTIGFGAKKGGPTAVKSWADVEAMLPNTGDAAKANVLALTPVDGLTTPTTAPPKKELATLGDTATAAPPAQWSVRGGRFAFDTATSVPATRTTFGSHTFNGDEFHVHPLDVSGASSAVAVTIKDAGGRSAAAAFEAAPIQRNAPAALWGDPGAAVPSAEAQLVPGQAMGLSLQVLPPEIGATAGPVGVTTALAHADLALHDAAMPLSGAAQPTGDVPVASAGTVARIADPGKGIGSAGVTGSRGAIYAGLAAIGYAPAAANDPMTSFAAEVDCALAAEPMMVGA